MNMFNKDVDQDSAFHDHKLPGNLDYLRDIKIVAPQFLINAILPVPSFSAIIGPSYSYKTFIELDMALSVAAGIPFHGYEVTQGTAVYINGEGRHGVMTRISLVRKQSITTQPSFILSKAPINLRDQTALAN